jgi:hypothetical protein
MLEVRLKTELSPVSFECTSTNDSPSELDEFVTHVAARMELYMNIFPFRSPSSLNRASLELFAVKRIHCGSAVKPLPAPLTSCHICPGAYLQLCCCAIGNNPQVDEPRAHRVDQSQLPVIIQNLIVGAYFSARLKLEYSTSTTPQRIMFHYLSFAA